MAEEFSYPEAIRECARFKLLHGITTGTVSYGDKIECGFEDEGVPVCRYTAQAVEGNAPLLFLGGEMQPPRTICTFAAGMILRNDIVEL